MLGVINLIVGVAMAAGSAVFPIETASSFIKLCKELLNANSEYIGDSTQGFIPYIVKKIQNWKASKAIDAAIKGQDGVDICKQVFNEINEGLTNNRSVLGRNIFHRNTKKQQIKNDARAVAELSFKSLFNVDYNSFLNDNSQTYQGLDPNQKAQIIEIIKIAVQAFYEYKFSKIDPDLQIACGVISMSIKSYIDDEEEKFSQKLISCITDHNNGSISLQAVANAKFAPKYRLRSCPGCGYDGDRLLVDEKTGTVKCAACGKSYDLVQYAEPELYEKMEVKLQELNQKGIEEFNQLNIKLNDLKQQNQLTSENLMIAIKDFKKERGKLIGDNFKGVLDACEGLKDDTVQLKTKMENLSNLCELLVENKEEIQKQFAEQCKLGVTKEYLDACLKGQTNQFSEKFESLIDDKFNAVTDSVFSNLQQGQQEILDFLKKKTEEDRQVVGHFSQKLDSLDKQVNSLYEYAKEMFPELSGKSDLILEYVQKLCSKEYYEEMSNALGTDINKAISMEMKNGYEHIQALNSTSVSQIISAIEDLKKDCAKEGGVDQKIIEDSIRNANVQLSGQITGLQSLVESNHKESRAAFKEIIRSQDEIKAILLARIGLKVESHDFEKMYKGEIPSEYLLDEGIGEPFPCPYCGVKEERRISADGYCKCKICGHKFLAVSPFFPADKFAREHDDFRATEEKIKDWRKDHEAKLENRINDVYRVTIPDSTHRDGILIIPNTDCNGNSIKDINYTIFWQENTLESLASVEDVKYLLFGEGINTLGHNGGKAFNQLTELKAVIFYQEDNLTRIGKDALREFRKCLGSSTTIYGQRAQPVNWNLARED